MNIFKPRTIEEVAQKYRKHQLELNKRQIIKLKKQIKIKQRQVRDMEEWVKFLLNDVGEFGR